ncbi:MAG: mechanosensitive ion channel family protein [Bacteroidetes bacterium]|nr:MAG: mechanosensitive ion channel family protein [Bacteroidota bacterium]
MLKRSSVVNIILNNFFISIGLEGLYSTIASKAVLIIGVVLLSFLVDLIAKNILLSVIRKIVYKTKSKWDDILVERGLFNRLAHIVPVLVLYYAVPLIFPEANTITALLQRIIISYMIAVVLMMLSSLLAAVNTIYSTYKISKNRPIKGYLQIVRVFISIFGIILIVTTILDKSALGLLSGIGALSAVLMLVFKDSILGLVAAIQLSGNDMIQIGDWVTVPSFGADGDVIDIKLQTVSIQNFDKTIVSVPIYSLISSSFKNWRGMSESDGRRIKRHLSIDMNSIKFCSVEMIERFKKIDILGDYISSKQKDIDEDNSTKKANTSEMINGRRMTNLGVFRAYIEAYLHNNANISDKMTFLVRQLQPTDKGISLELYVFSNDTHWANYEGIQADIFDHLLASISYFDLAVYQTQSSLDLRQGFNNGINIP